MMSETLPGREFPDGLALIYVGRFPVPDLAHDLTFEEPLSREVIVDVPKKTKYAHVAVTALNMSFGPKGTYIPSAMARIVFEVMNREDSNDDLAKGKYKFNFRALLQNASQHTPTGKWSGQYWFEIMCFGEIPAPSRK
jgi:hypothetical protein